MSLNDVKLPVNAIASLYRQTLVGRLRKDAVLADEKVLKPVTAESNGQEKGTAPASATVFKYLGNNQKRISIALQSPDSVFVDEEELNLLTKLLEACKMNLSDVAIVNLSNHSINAEMINNQLNPSVMLLFGISPLTLGIPFDIPMFKIQAHNNCRYLCAPPLSQLLPNTEESKLLKSKLWVCLRTIFGI